MNGATTLQTREGKKDLYLTGNIMTSKCKAKVYGVWTIYFQVVIAFWESGGSRLDDDPGVGNVNILTEYIYE